MEVNNAGKSKINVEAVGARHAFDRFHNFGSDSYYSPCEFQNGFSGDSEWLSQAIPTDLSLLNNPPFPFNSWAAQDDPYQLINCGQGLSKNRNLTDGDDCGSETDLYGLVSTILEEVNPTDSYFSPEISSGLKTVWSPKSMKEESLHNLNSGANLQSSSSMQSNNLCPESVGRDSNQSNGIYQHFNGFDAADQTWHFSTGNGDSPARPPPGLAIPPAANTFLSKNRMVNSENGKDSSFCSTSNALTESLDSLNDHCSFPKELNDSYFIPYQDSDALNKSKIKNSRSFSMPDSNKMASNIQALLMGQHGDVFKNDYVQNSLVKTQDENMVDMKTFSFQNLYAFGSHMPSHQRDTTMSLREQRGSEARKGNSLQSDYITKEFSRFTQEADYSEPLSSFSSSFNPPNPSPSKEVSQGESRVLQSSLHQYHGQSNQYQSQAKLSAESSFNSDHQGMSKLMSHSVAEFVPLLSSQQRPTARVLSDFGQGNGVNLQENMGQAGLGLGLDGLRNVACGGDRGDVGLHLDKGRLSGATAAPEGQFGVKVKPPASFPREAEKDHHQSPYHVVGNMFAGETRRSGSVSSQVKPVSPQMLPYMYQMGGCRQNSCHSFPSRSLVRYGASMPFVDMSELVPDGEFPTLNPYLQDLMGSNPAGGDGLFNGFLSNTRPAKLSKCHTAPISQLHHYLEECYEQWRMLEKERKKTDAALVKSYPGKRASVAGNNSLPKMPPNPSRVDRLIVDQLREQAKVVSLLGKMERLRSFPLHANICSALDRHLEAIHITQARRKDESLNNSSKQRQSSAYSREDREILLLAVALKDLSSSTRKSRTVLWAALQMTLPKTSSSLEDGGERDPCSP